MAAVVQRVQDRASVDRLAELAGQPDAAPVAIMDATDWQSIPSENLVAAFQVRPCPPSPPLPNPPFPGPHHLHHPFTHCSNSLTLHCPDAQYWECAPLNADANSCRGILQDLVQCSSDTCIVLLGSQVLAAAVCGAAQSSQMRAGHAPLPPLVVLPLLLPQHQWQLVLCIDCMLAESVIQAGEGHLIAPRPALELHGHPLVHVSFEARLDQVMISVNPISVT